MKTSARNHFAGIITAIEEQNGLALITVRSQETDIVALISPFAFTKLQPKIGNHAVVLAKAPSITLLTELPPFRFAAENCLHGTVSRLEQGAVNHIVTLTLADGQTITATITLHASEDLSVHVGQEMYAVFNASQAILGVM